jgi:hypothetical protein
MLTRMRRPMVAFGGHKDRDGECLLSGAEVVHSILLPLLFI